MREFDEKSITRAVIGRLSECADPRFKRIMTSFITHLHDFVREVKLTEPEWLTAMQFLTSVGQTCTDKRQEFILVSDTLGVSVLVITLNHPADERCVESTVLGPFYWEGAPDLPRGSNLAEGVKGEPAFYSGCVLSEDGRPLENALLDIWSGDGEGSYDMQIPGETGMKARGRIRTDAEGHGAAPSMSTANRRRLARSHSPCRAHQSKQGAALLLLLPCLVARVIAPLGCPQFFRLEQAFLCHTFTDLMLKRSPTPVPRMKNTA